MYQRNCNLFLWSVFILSLRTDVLGRREGLRTSSERLPDPQHAAQFNLHAIKCWLPKLLISQFNFFFFYFLQSLSYVSSNIIMT